MTGALIRKKCGHRCTQRGEYHVKTWTQENWSTAAAHLGTPALAARARRQGLILPRRSEEVWPCWHLNFRLLASRTVRQISVVLSHRVCSTLVWQPQETNTVSVSHIFSLLPRTSTKPSLILSYPRRKDCHPCVSAGTTVVAELGGTSFRCPEEYPSTLPWAESPLEWHHNEGVQAFQLWAGGNRKIKHS